MFITEVIAKGGFDYTTLTGVSNFCPSYLHIWGGQNNRDTYIAVQYTNSNYDRDAKTCGRTANAH